MNGELLTVSY